MIAMRRYLVIANQTLAEAALMDAIRDRLKAGPSSFYVLVPNTSARDLAARLASHVPLPPAVGDPTTDAEASAHAQHRLGQLLDDLRSLGAEVGGELGDPDPLEAVSQLLERQQFDEIILSTLPQPISRWLGMDLPRRLQRRFNLPVTTITSRA
jgi:hypothetical protein